MSETDQEHVVVEVALSAEHVRTLGNIAKLMGEDSKAKVLAVSVTEIERGHFSTMIGGFGTSTEFVAAAMHLLELGAESKKTTTCADCQREARVIWAALDTLGGLAEHIGGMH